MASDATDILAPDFVMPDQFFGEPGTRGGGSGERGLMIGVLEDAVGCFQSYALARDPHRRFEFEEAKRWIESDDREWPFSFVNICGVLGFDPACLRDGLSKHDTRSAPVSTERIKPIIVPLEARKRCASLEDLEQRDVVSAGDPTYVSEAAA